MSWKSDDVHALGNKSPTCDSVERVIALKSCWLSEWFGSLWLREMRELRLLLCSVLTMADAGWDIFESWVFSPVWGPLKPLHSMSIIIINTLFSRGSPKGCGVLYHCTSLPFWNLCNDFLWYLENNGISKNYIYSLFTGGTLCVWNRICIYLCLCDFNFFSKTLYKWLFFCSPLQCVLVYLLLIDTLIFNETYGDWGIQPLLTCLEEKYSFL